MIQGCPGLGACHVTMDAAKSVIATFALNPVLFVKPAGTGNCIDWANACILQTALSSASSGQEIWVAAGLYKPLSGSNRSATFQLVNGVDVYGGFAGIESSRDQRNPATNLSILSGDIDNNDSQVPMITDPGNVTGNTTNSYHVVTGATGGSLDGVSITAGYADSASPRGGVGAGLFNFNASPTLTNINFTGNYAAASGGGMFNDASNPRLENITFNGNQAGKGGGIFNLNSNPTLTNITISGNSVTQSGGGIYNDSSSPTLTNVTFTNDSAQVGGGGIYNANSSPAIDNSIFWENKAPTGAQLFNNPASTPKINDAVIQDGCPAGSTCANIIVTDPMLGMLWNYGGSAQVIPLQPGSSAIDAGNDTTSRGHRSAWHHPAAGCSLRYRCIRIL